MEKKCQYCEREAVSIVVEIRVKRPQSSWANPVWMEWVKDGHPYPACEKHREESCLRTDADKVAFLRELEAARSAEAVA